MSDEEIICTWMEPPTTARFPERWWYAIGSKRQPCTLDLDALHEVEARLTYHQLLQYQQLLLNQQIFMLMQVNYEDLWRLLHASAADKIKALATVLRPIVEAAQKEKVSA